MRTASLLLTAAVVSGLAFVPPAQAAPAGVAVPGETNLTSTTHDLGTLGGDSSHASAVAGTVVVGTSDTASGDRHAFAYDLAAVEPEMLDLGTLGGDSSSATDVFGSVVVGASKTVSGEEHAFAYDLAAAEPVMQDLGTLGGGWSRAEAVDGTVVVGRSATASGAGHAFAYDLAAAEPVMQDLGTLGDSGSGATAVDGAIVVGYSYVPTDPGNSDPYELRAFAYDLAAAEPVMQDLGTLGGSGSFAEAVDGHVVVGWSFTARNPKHAFAYDLAAAEPEMIDLGVIGRDMGSKAVDVDDKVVVGTSSSTRLTNKFRPFTYDLAVPEPVMEELGSMEVPKTWATGIDGDVVIGEWRIPQRGYHAFAHDLGADDPRSLGLGTWRGSEALDVAGDVVVGRATHGSGSRATAWVLRETTRPMIAFRRFEQRVKEGVGRATIRVTRYGRTDRAVTMRYRTRSDSAEAGQDFVATSGTLRFPRGVTHRRFKVKIRDDRRREGTEYLLLTLSRPSDPALLGTPSWSQLRIDANDR